MVKAFTEVEAAEGLLGGGDEVHVVVRVGCWAVDVVEAFTEVLKLADLLHDLATHEEWSVHWGEAAGLKEVETVPEEGLVEAEGCTLQVEAAVAGDAGATGSVVTVDHVEKDVVGLEVWNFWDFAADANGLVFGFVLADWDVVLEHDTDVTEHLLELFEEFVLLLFCLGDLLVKFLALVADFGLLFGGDVLLLHFL